MKAPVQKSSELPRPAMLTFHSTAAQFEDSRSQMTGERSEFLEEWQDISDYIQTRRGAYLKGKRKKRRQSKILNETPIYASRVLGSGMMAGVASASRPWLKLMTPDSDKNEDKDNKLWLDLAQRKMYQIFAGSNYYGKRHSSFRDMGDFGQGPMIIDEDFEDMICAHVSPPGEYLIGCDHRGRVDTLYREMSRTVLQLVKKFGRNVPREVMDCYDRGDYQALYTMIHVCEPNRRHIKGALGPLGMPYINLYYCVDVEDSNSNAIMQTSGYHEKPFSSARWDVQGVDAYGDGCGSLALNSSKSLQQTEKREGQIVDKLAVPPTQAPSGMEKKNVSHKPGGMSYYPESILAQGGSGAHGPIMPLYRIDPAALPAVSEVGQKLEDRINRAYFVDMFLMISQSRRTQPETAREVQEKHEEKLIALGPVLDNTHSEGLDVEVSRTFNILTRSGALPPPPPGLDGAMLKVEYTSILAVAQRAIGVSQIERVTGFLGNLAAGDPAIMDKWDRDQTVDEYTDAIGAPASMIRSDEEVAKLREDRAKKEQQAEGMQQAALGAQSAKVLSEADTSRDSNLLADILGGSVGRG